jgi:hypothetical protein
LAVLLSPSFFVSRSQVELWIALALPRSRAVAGSTSSIYKTRPEIILRASRGRCWRRLKGRGENERSGVEPSPRDSAAGLPKQTRRNDLKYPVLQPPQRIGRKTANLPRSRRPADERIGNASPGDLIPKLRLWGRIWPYVSGARPRRERLKMVAGGELNYRKTRLTPTLPNLIFSGMKLRVIFLLLTLSLTRAYSVDYRIMSGSDLRRFLVLAQRAEDGEQISDAEVPILIYGGPYFKAFLNASIVEGQRGNGNYFSVPDNTSYAQIYIVVLKYLNSFPRPLETQIASVLFSQALLEAYSNPAFKPAKP